MVAWAFSTRNVPQKQAFAYWQDLVCDHFIRLECSSSRRANFDGSFELHRFGDLEISSMKSDEMRVRRSPGSMGSAGGDYFIVPIQAKSCTEGSQDGREFRLQPGDFAVFDTTRPYEASLLPEFEHCLLRIPRRSFQRRLGSIDMLTAVRIAGDRGVGKLTSDFLRGLPSQLRHVDEATCLRLSETALDLVTMAIAENFSLPSGDSSAVAAHRMRVKSFVEANLRREDLSVAVVGKALKLSPRHLNRLFEAENVSLWQYISGRRLEKCRAAFDDTRWDRLTIAEIAYDFGFCDISHFSRAFHRRFGQSPREYRSLRDERKARAASSA
jgi:AraC-like DNA-binding protein